jgi:hypothetical protein
MLGTVRLGFRRLRLELLILVLASLALSAITAIIALGIVYATQAQASCTAPGDCSSTGPTLASWVSWVPYDRAALVGLSVMAGVILGTSLVASEMESGTAVFAWSIVPRRCRWLSDAYVIGICGLMVIAIPLAIASAGLSAALGPQADSTSSPSGLDTAPLLLIVRSWAACSIAAVVGVVVGRSLPTLLLAGLAACLVLGALELTFGGWRDAAAVPIDLSATGAFYVSDAAVASDGHVVSVSDALATADRLGKPPDELYQFVQLGLPAQTRAWMLAGEAGSITAVAAAGLLAAWVLAERRRPI